MAAFLFKWLLVGGFLLGKPVPVIHPIYVSVGELPCVSFLSLRLTSSVRPYRPMPSINLLLPAVYLAHWIPLPSLMESTADLGADRKHRLKDGRT